MTLLPAEFLGNAGAVRTARLGFDLVDIRLRGRSVADADGEPSAVPCVIAVRGNLEGERIAGFHAQIRKCERDFVVVAVSGVYIDLLFQKQFIVVPDPKRHAVRPVRVGVLMAELDI